MATPDPRPTRDEVFLNVAHEVKQRATCGRRKVGCVLVNDRGHVLATGYNGVPSGWPHCPDQRACPGLTAQSGEGLDECYAIHAEQNALLQCADVQKIHTCYVTVSPCVHCVKLLLNTGCSRIVTSDVYDVRSKELWERGGGTWLVR